MAAIFSVAPMLVAARTDVQAGLRAGQRSGGSRGASRLFSILIACEAAFAFLLLVGSGLMVRSLIRLQQADHGLRTEHVLTMRAPIGSLTQTTPRGKYATKARQMSYYRELVERLQRIPGVDAVAVVNNLPLSGVNTSLSGPIPGLEGITVSARTISSQYFSVMGIPILGWPRLHRRRHAEFTPVVIINEFMARALFPNRDPVGQFLPGGSIDDRRRRQEYARNELRGPAQGGTVPAISAGDVRCLPVDPGRANGSRPDDACRDHPEGSLGRSIPISPL